MLRLITKRSAGDIMPAHTVLGMLEGRDLGKA